MGPFEAPVDTKGKPTFGWESPSNAATARLAALQQVLDGELRADVDGCQPYIAVGTLVAEIAEASSR